jgi:hypothetical protein
VGIQIRNLSDAAKAKNHFQAKAHFQHLLKVSESKDDLIQEAFLKTGGNVSYRLSPISSHRVCLQYAAAIDTDHGSADTIEKSRRMSTFLYIVALLLGLPGLVAMIMALSKI